MTGAPSARGLSLLLLLAWPLQPMDDGVRSWVQALRRPALESPMRRVSDRSRAVLFAGSALALVAGPAGRAFVAEAAVVLLPVNVAVESLKWLVNRPRPDGDRERRNSSFPSSHAANAFALAAVLSRRWRGAIIPAWLAASLVAFSRLYLDRHWLSDVLFSLVLSLAAAWLAARVISRVRQRMTTPRST